MIMLVVWFWSTLLGFFEVFISQAGGYP